MARSANIYTGDGVTTQFVVNFTLGFISRGDVVAYVEDELDGSLNQIYRTITWINDGLIDIGTAPADTKQVFIRRVMDKTALQHDFQDGAIQNEQSLDEANLQLLYIMHEILDGFYNVNDADDSDTALTIRADVDMQSVYKIINMLDPTADQDGATKAYVDSVIAIGAANEAAAAASAAAALISENSAAADAIATAADAVSTAADVALTAQDVIDAAAQVALAQAEVSLAQAEVGYAQEWATKAEDSLISVAAGGNGTTDYSALHWAAKSQAAASGVTYENLDANGDVGTGAGQVAIGNHTHTGVYEPADATILKDADIGTAVLAYAASASQGEMEAGTEAALRAMSPLRVAQAIAALASGGALDTQTFTANGTWTKPGSGNFAIITGWGGGGGGGAGSTGSRGAGGGGGAFSWFIVDLSFLGATEAVIVGAGGAGTATGSTNGADGGDTSLGTHFVIGGGKGGQGTSGVNKLGGDGGDSIFETDGATGGDNVTIGGTGVKYGGAGGGGGGSSATAGGGAMFGGAGGSAADALVVATSVFGGDGGIGGVYGGGDGGTGVIPGGGGGGVERSGTSGSGARGSLTVHVF